MYLPDDAMHRKADRCPAWPAAAPALPDQQKGMGSHLLLPSPAPHVPASAELASITLPHAERCLLTEVIPVTATN